jgi:hypothetical protein
VAWFFHVVEALDGRWHCRHGHDIDQHPTLEAALEHTSSLAASSGPAEIFVHHLSGDVHRLGAA